VKLQGVVSWFDNFCVLLRRDGQSQLIYKHAISTVMPTQWDGFDDLNLAPRPSGRAPSLQEIFLGAVQGEEEPVTMFLVNGVMLQGRIAAFDLFCILLERDNHYQLVYKHAVSTVQPQSPVKLSSVPDDDDADDAPADDASADDDA
jgi:host factor-I protein